MTSYEGATPEQARANRRLGLILGAVVLAMIAGFIALFTFKGLPQDREALKRLERERAARRTAAGEAPAIPPVGGAAEPASVGDPSPASSGGSR